MARHPPGLVVKRARAVYPPFFLGFFFDNPSVGWNWPRTVAKVVDLAHAMKFLFRALQDSCIGHGRSSRHLSQPNTHSSGWEP